MPLWWLWLFHFNYNFECDWIIELSDNKLADNKMSNNNLERDLVEYRGKMEYERVRE